MSSMSMSTVRNERMAREDSMDLELKNRRDDERPDEASDGDEQEAKTAASIPLLPIYLREMGATPLLTADQEVELARELMEARQGVAALLLQLPGDARRYVLEGDLRGPKRGHEWPLDRLEAACRQLRTYQRESDSPRVRDLTREVLRQKARLDRARDAMVLANLRLVTHIAKKYSNQGVAFMDLIQEGNIGLMKAVEKFDHLRGYKFSTYAFWWIKQAVTRAIADKARLIRIPVHVNEKLKKMKRISHELSESLGRQPTPKEIARKMRMSVRKVDELLDIVQDPIHLESAGGEDDSTGVLPFVADPNSINPVQLTMDRELKEKIHSALRVLDEREEEIIRLRFGIGREECHTLEAIGKVVNLSRERVRQIEAIALRKIHETQESRDLAKHLIA